MINDLELELPMEIMGLLSLEEDGPIVEAMNCRLVDIEPIVRKIPESDLITYWNGLGPMFALKYYFPRGLVLLTDRRMIVISKKERFHPPYGKVMNTVRMDYRDMLKPVEDGRLLILLTGKEDGPQVLHLFQFFEVDLKQPGLETWGRSIPNEEFLRRLAGLKA